MTSFKTLNFNGWTDLEPTAVYARLRRELARGKSLLRQRQVCASK